MSRILGTLGLSEDSPVLEHIRLAETKSKEKPETKSKVKPVE